MENHHERGNIQNGLRQGETQKAWICPARPGEAGELAQRPGGPRSWGGPGTQGIARLGPWTAGRRPGFGAAGRAFTAGSARDLRPCGDSPVRAPGIASSPVWAEGAPGRALAGCSAPARPGLGGPAGGSPRGAPRALRALAAPRTARGAPQPPTPRSALPAAPPPPRPPGPPCTCRTCGSEGVCAEGGIFPTGQLGDVEATL